MSLEPKSSEIAPAPESQPWNSTVPSRKALFLRRKTKLERMAALFLLIVLAIGLGGVYLIVRQSMPATKSQSEKESIVDGTEIYPPEGYTIAATFGDIGPQLLATGAIDLPKFLDLYKQSGVPLNDEQLAILTKGSNTPIVINQENASFLLNFFWAFGLTNQNPILTEGLMVSQGKDKAGNFASTGGWTVGVKPPMELYASTAFIHLTEEQQAQLLKVASTVYRPCCDNPTHFPDCNHGMAMLGLLELMASQNASEAEMYNAAKYVNAYWFPQQTLEIAVHLKATQKVDFAQADAALVVGREYSSGSGSGRVHQWLVENGLLEQSPNSGGSCKVQ
jgi:hypothetical protein